MPAISSTGQHAEATATGIRDVDLLTRFEAIVGPAGLINEAKDRAPYETDWRGIYSGTALVVLCPASTDEVVQLVRLCAEWQVPIVVQGGNTSLCAGASPDQSGRQVILSLRRMRKMRSIDAENACIVCEAGLTLAEAQAQADQAGLLLPLSIASGGSATIGGTVSTNAGGVNVLRYGTMRRLVLGVEAVLADGSVWSDLGSLRKDNTGYSVSALLSGAEGTLGIITAASLALSPRPTGYTTVMVGLDTPEQAMTALHRVRALTGNAVTAWELFNDVSATILAADPVNMALPLGRTHPWYLLGELSGYGSDNEDSDRTLGIVAEVLGEMGLTDAVPATSLGQRAELWALREGITEAERAEGYSLKHDVSVQTSVIAHLAKELKAACTDLDPQLRLNIFGHVGDGNLHVNVLPLKRGEPLPPDLARAATRMIYDKVHQAGGSFSAEHGVGLTKRDEMARYKDPVAIRTMRRIKDALDPDGILNPGRLLP